MESPQAPAWLRTYKTRAAPFASNATRSSDISTLPPMGKISEEPDISKYHSRSESDPQEQPERYSFAFQSTLSLPTLSLPLQSFDPPRATTPSQSTIHPAHRTVYSDTEDRQASNSSSVTIKDDVGQDQNTTKSLDGEQETGWKKMVKGWIRKLACSGER